MEKLKKLKGVMESFGGNLSLIISGGGALAPEKQRWLSKFAGTEVVNGMGATEV